MEEILKEKTSCRSRNEDWGGVKTRRYPVWCGSMDEVSITGESAEQKPSWLHRATRLSEFHYRSSTDYRLPAKILR